MAVLTVHIKSIAGLGCCLALAASAGCRNLDNAQVDVLERELRQQEDYIYELEDYLVEYSEKLRQARLTKCDPVSTSSKSETLPTPQTQLREPTLDEDPVTRPTLPMNGRNKLIPPTSEAPPAAESTAAPAGDAPPLETPVPQPEEDAEPAPVNPRDLEAPALEIGPGVGSSETSHTGSTAAAPVLPPESNPSAPLLIPDPIDYQADAEGDVDAEASSEPKTEALAVAPAEPLLAAPTVNPARLSAERLQIRRVFAEPGEGDKTPGSLLVVVEALNATDEPVDAIGAASIMVMVNDAPGSFQRIARWDFTAEETAAAWQSSHLGDGLHLELPLADDQLPHGELQLWARVVDDNGAKLLTPADKPYRFDTAQLASMADAAQEAVLASTEAEDPENQQSQPVAIKAETSGPAATNSTAAEAAKPQWRASAVRLDKDRVEGFATTASGERSAWTTKPIDGAQPRVASAPSKTGRPVWKRSASSAATETRPAWTPDR